MEHLTSNNTVYFLTFNQSPKFTDKAKVIKMREIPLKSASAAGWMEGPRMYTLALLRAVILRMNLKRFKPLVVFACMATKYGFYTALSGFRPFILVVWGTDVLIAPKRFFLIRFLAKYSLRKAAAVILDSEVQKKAAIQLGCDSKKIVEFPWFDLSNVRPEVSREEVRRNLGWAENLIVICTRSHEPIYGVEYLIEAIPHVIRKLPETRFLILGQGQLTEFLIRRTKELKVESAVRFLGSLPRREVVSYLNAADLNVSPSFSDGTSASLLEAMALGIPSVATDIPGNREWIKHGEEGYLVPIKDSQKLAETMVLLLKDAQERQKMGKRAISRVQKKADWNTNSKVLDNLISKLAKQTGSGKN